MRFAEAGIVELHKVVDTLLIIPNQNLFRVANEKTTFADAFAMADQVLYSGVACITDLMVKEGLINLDFADVRAVMREMGKAMMGTGEASGEKRALTAAEAAISNPLIDDASMKGARGLLISITGGKDLTLYEVDEAATRIREEVDQDANIIVGATFDETLEGIIRVSVVATGIDHANAPRQQQPAESALKELAGKLRSDSRRIADRIERSPHAGHAPASRRSESAAHAAVAAAIMPPTAIEDVSIRPMPMKPSLFEPVGEPPAGRTADAGDLHSAGAGTHACARRACRASTNCRCRRRTRCGRNAASLPTITRKSAAMSLMQRLASVGLGRSAEEAEAPPAPRTARPMPQFERPPQRPTARQSGRPARGRRRCRNMPGAPRRRVSTRTAGRRLCIIRPRKTSSISRPSCAGRPTDRSESEDSPAPATWSGAARS